MGASGSGAPTSSSYGHADEPRRRDDPYSKPPRGGPSVAVRVASQIVQQDKGTDESVSHMDEEARRRVTQARDNEDAKQQAVRQAANVILGLLSQDKRKLMSMGVERNC